MPSYLQNLQAAREQIAANLATITAQPKPNYTLDGQSVSWQSLVESYTEQLVRLDALILAAEPFEIISHGTTGP